MEKKSTKIIETRVFDSYAEARDVVSVAEEKRKRILIGLGIAAVATVLAIIGFKLQGTDFGAVCVLFAFVLAIPAYFLGGGIGLAIKTAWRLATVGWVIVPFPFDIITGLLTFIVAIYAFFCAPVVFVFLNFLRHDKDYKEAQRYLSYFKETSEQNATTE